ncbi:MAG TPA: TetR/AcrR family transcriptional regulator [Vitreimonas sp.]|uniref:TetR/AcrR family transcriptional regulator n=1 Tax=Vitreimonas sp. TaxID=3069702 RepID=UPI002D724773|nr:TetR/AcrR family transcriptional regulator [Vitreimonas sp.]HYD87066.1 TetR/AcrR family transcriptional regulator [Vitreimonas sp.]
MSDTDLKSPSRGERTRVQLMDIAQVAILEKGYAATSIDELIAQAGITKSGFFYHFEDKLNLGKQLLRRDNEMIEAGLTQIFEAADKTHDCPLEALLEGVLRYGRAAAESPTERPGCLAAAFSYQEALFDEEVREAVRAGLVFRRRVLRERLERVVAKYPPAAPVDLEALADMLVAVIQGGMVIDRVRDEPGVLQAQVELYCAYLRAVFKQPGESSPSRPVSAASADL